MHIPIQINENTVEPLYSQIESQLRSLIITGQIKEGTLLPSIREFASNLRCSVITVRRVYQDLENEGLLRTKQGTGTFVAQVGIDKKEDYKQAAVKEALIQAAKVGRSVGSTREELEHWFSEVMNEFYREKEETEK